MTDRSSRPHTMPAKTPPATTKRIVSLRLRKRLGPVQLAALVGVAPSTVHRVLTRCRLNRSAHVDRATGEPVRRYEHPHPGSMLHGPTRTWVNDVTRTTTITHLRVASAGGEEPRSAHTFDTRPAGNFRARFSGARHGIRVRMGQPPPTPDPQEPP